MTDLFDIDGDNLDVGYVNIRAGASTGERHMRAALQAMWGIFEPYADPDFRNAFARDPEARFWEMILGYSLLDAGKTLAPVAEREHDNGCPDICVIEGERRIWIEAIAPSPGDPGPDQVVGPVPINEGGGLAQAPVRQAQLRMTSALLTKSEAFSRYLDGDVVGPEDIRLVAISAGRFGAYVSEHPMPLILSSVFPFGDEFVTVDRETGNPVAQGYEPSLAIAREAGDVPRTAFLEDAFSHLSGIVWSRIGIGNMSRNVRPISLVHNPTAAIPMPQNWGVWDREFVASEDNGAVTIRDILAAPPE